MKREKNFNEIAIGFTDAEPIYCEDKETPFIKKRANRTDPKKYLPSAKNVIVIGIPYQANFDFENDGKPRGKISQFAIGGDYHVFTREKLLEILKPLNCNYKIFADSGTLYEKGFAIKAGVGFMGKNCLVISEKFGSFIYLGVALTDADISPPPGAPVKSSCGDCELCVKACPNGALAPYRFDYTKCVSYLTQKLTQKPGETQNLAGYLYGCDICQTVCPFNRGKFVRTIRDINLAKPELDYIQNLTQNEFSLKYGDTPMNWRGLEILKRNARLNLQNKG
jgi:epoxyqueuosine reductase